MLSSSDEVTAAAAVVEEVDAAGATDAVEGVAVTGAVAVVAAATAAVLAAVALVALLEALLAVLADCRAVPDRDVVVRGGNKDVAEEIPLIAMITPPWPTVTGVGNRIIGGQPDAADVHAAYPPA